MANRFEIGTVYAKQGTGRPLLAVDAGTLLSFRSGRPRTVSPRSASYRIVRGMSVDELCRRWGIRIEDLDAATAPYERRAVAECNSAPGARRRQKRPAPPFTVRLAVRVAVRI